LAAHSTRPASHSYKTRRRRRADHRHSNVSGIRKMSTLVTVQVENQNEALYGGMPSALTPHVELHSLLTVEA
jgi:hypothetical protein